MPGAVTAARSADESRLVPHVQQLPPSPRCEIFAVALFPLLKIFGWLPVFALTEQFLVGNVFARRQKILEVHGLYGTVSDWLTYLPIGKVEPGPFATLNWLGHLSASGVVRVGDDFRDHSDRIFSRRTERITAEGTGDAEKVETGNRLP